MFIFVRALSIAAMLATGATAAQAQATSNAKPPAPPHVGAWAAPAGARTAVGPTRPAAAPPGYVITPFGYFHSSCVVHLAQGDQLRSAEQVVRHANGSTSTVPKCAYPHFRADGQRVGADERDVAEPNISHAWVEDVAVQTTTAYGELYAEWSVPPTPTSADGQTLFYFPGLEDSKNVVTILQPVLGWNSDYKNAWGIAAWNCCQSGTTFESPPKPANPGDTILGYIFNTCAAGVVDCASWDVVIWDLQNNQWTDLVNTSSFKQVFNWAFGGVLEVYNIVQCSDYPSNGPYWGSHAISFHQLGLYDYNFALVANPKWYVENRWSTLSPQCGYGASLPSEAILTY